MDLYDNFVHGVKEQLDNAAQLYDKELAPIYELYKWFSYGSESDIVRTSKAIDEVETVLLAVASGLTKILDKDFTAELMKDQELYADWDGVPNKDDMFGPIVEHAKICCHSVFYVINHISYRDVQRFRPSLNNIARLFTHLSSNHASHLKLLFHKLGWFNLQNPGNMSCQPCDPEVAICCASVVSWFIHQLATSPRLLGVTVNKDDPISQEASINLKLLAVIRTEAMNVWKDIYEVLKRQEMLAPLWFYALTPIKNVHQDVFKMYEYTLSHEPLVETTGGKVKEAESRASEESDNTGDNEDKEGNPEQDFSFQEELELKTRRHQVDSLEAELYGTKGTFKRAQLVQGPQPGPTPQRVLPDAVARPGQQSSRRARKSQAKIVEAAVPGSAKEDDVVEDDEDGWDTEQVTVNASNASWDEVQPAVNPIASLDNPQGLLEPPPTEDARAQQVSTSIDVSHPPASSNKANPQAMKARADDWKDAGTLKN